MGKGQKAKAARAGARKAAKGSCLTKSIKAKPAGAQKKSSLLVPTRTKTASGASARPPAPRAGPSAQKLALKARRREEEAARGRAKAAAFAAERRQLAPPEVAVWAVTRCLRDVSRRAGVLLNILSKCWRHSSPD